MTVTSPPSLGKIIAEFGGPSNLGAYVRGGAYVPNVAANAAVSTTAAGLKISQFVGATKYTVPVLSGPATVSWTGDNRKPPGTFTASTGTAVSGGAAATTIQWVRLSGSAAITCNNPGVVNATFAAVGGLTPGDAISETAVWRLTYSDGTTTRTKDVTLHFSSV
jgi:hypothetical protein